MEVNYHYSLEFYKQNLKDKIKEINDTALNLYRGGSLLKEKVQLLFKNVENAQYNYAQSTYNCIPNSMNVPVQGEDDLIVEAQQNLRKALKFFAKKDKSNAETVKAIALTLLENQTKSEKHCSFVQDNLHEFKKLASITGPLNIYSLQVAEQKAFNATVKLNKQAKTTNKINSKFVEQKAFLKIEKKLKNLKDLIIKYYNQNGDSQSQGLCKAMQDYVKICQIVKEEQDKFMFALQNHQVENPVLVTKTFANIFLNQKESPYISNLLRK